MSLNKNKDMKKLPLLMLSIISAGVFSYAHETVSMGADYVNQVFYSLEDGIVSTTPSANWDLAFSASSFGSSIRINDAYGARLYLYDGPVSDYEALDATGLDWTPLYNAPSSWFVGAFNFHQTSNFDLGWGMYNIDTHIVEDYFVYVFKTVDGVYKKIFIEQIKSGVYHLIHDNLDNSARDTSKIARADFDGKNFGYFSFTTNDVVDREPLSEDRDLTPL